MNPHFEIFTPIEAGPLVVEIPHAGLVIDDAAAKFTRVPEAALAAGAILADSDVGADRPWDGTEARGITRIVAHASRYVIDLNTEPRLPTPAEEKLPEPLRAVRRISACGQHWRENPLPRRELERRLREVFEPYHAAVAAALEQARERHGLALLLSFHTYSVGTLGATADVVIGTRHGASAGAALRDRVAEIVRAQDLSLALEEPFAGAYSLARHGRPSERISAVQLEISRVLPTARVEALVAALSALYPSGDAASRRFGDARLGDAR